MTSTPDNKNLQPLASVPTPVVTSTTPVSRVVWDSQALLNGQREVFIQHGAECYRLILTKSGKLILQK